ncbi:hemerythrin domain-containing protein [Paenibacillus doosanensis]|uniref:hemerythrin domain-containing protein n=1 Tax=Paenibacillus doosanensis TaxID=1229154 RepID=UPI0021806778|nr:hemerythrin domain-containing protein [Paenibacillus doosanensis]MCS7460940.1 hemerythrin domain-containing protein [Paenibacillus doosanensis]
MRQRMNMDLHFTTIGHPLYEFNEAVQRLREEHAMLEEGLGELCAAAKAIGDEEQTDDWTEPLLELRGKALAFQQELMAHSHWEEEKMFPMVAWYFGEEPDQFPLMEQEHELAEQCIEAFIKAADRIRHAVRRAEAQDMAAYLLQARSILKHHFRQEEEIIAALEDRSNRYGF